MEPINLQTGDGVNSNASALVNLGISGAQQRFTKYFKDQGPGIVEILGDYQNIFTLSEDFVAWAEARNDVGYYDDLTAALFSVSYQFSVSMITYITRRDFTNEMSQYLSQFAAYGPAGIYLMQIVSSAAGEIPGNTDPRRMHELAIDITEAVRNLLVQSLSHEVGVISARCADPETFIVNMLGDSFNAAMSYSEVHDHDELWPHEYGLGGGFAVVADIFRNGAFFEGMEENDDEFVDRADLLVMSHFDRFAKVFTNVTAAQIYDVGIMDSEAMVLGSGDKVQAAVDEANEVFEQRETEQRLADAEQAADDILGANPTEAIDYLLGDLLGGYDASQDDPTDQR